MKATIEHCRVKLLVLSVHCTGRLGLGFGHIVGDTNFGLLKVIFILSNYFW